MPKDEGVVKTKAVFSNSSLSSASDTSVSSAMRSFWEHRNKDFVQAHVQPGTCCPHGKACGGHLLSPSIQQSILELHTTFLRAAKTVVRGCAPHPTSCSWLVHLFPQMLLDSSVFAAAVPSESCPVTFAFVIQVTL